MHNVDANHNEIGDALRAAGCDVESVAAVGNDFPDWVVGYRGQNFLLEVKSEKGRLTEGQKRFHHKEYGWKGQKAVVRNIDEAFKAVGIDYE